MITQRAANLVFVVVVCAACGYFAWVAEGFVTSGLLASSGLPSKFFPQLTLAMVAACTAVVGYQYVMRGTAGDDKGETVFANAAQARQSILMLIVAVVCYVTWRWFGFLHMAVVLGPLSLIAMGIFKPIIYITVWALTALITLVFIYGLGIQLV